MTEHMPIPVVDLTAGDVPALVDRACRSTGFFVVVNHGVDEELLAEMERVTWAFFAQDPGSKRAWVRGDGQTGGYRPLQSASLGGPAAEEQRDLCEFLSINRFDGHRGDRNVWPDEPDDLADVWRRYYTAMEGLAGVLLDGFDRALAQPAGWFRSQVVAHDAALFANHYPAQDVPPSPGQQRLGAHTDFGLLTLLHQSDETEGLEVLTTDGSWSPVPRVEGSFVVNVGDLLSRWTNDRWASSFHRVVNPSPASAGRARLSLPFFLTPDADALVECLPSCVGLDTPCRYEPVIAGEWLAKRVQETRYPA